MLSILSGVFLIIGLVFVGFGILCLMLAGSLKARVPASGTSKGQGSRVKGNKETGQGSRGQGGSEAEVLVATKDGEIKKIKVN